MIVVYYAGMINEKYKFCSQQVFPQIIISKSDGWLTFITKDPCQEFSLYIVCVGYCVLSIVLEDECVHDLWITGNASHLADDTRWFIGIT